MHNVRCRVDRRKTPDSVYAPPYFLDNEDRFEYLMVPPQDRLWPWWCNQPPCHDVRHSGHHYPPPCHANNVNHRFSCYWIAWEKSFCDELWMYPRFCEYFVWSQDEEVICFFRKSCVPWRIIIFKCANNLLADNKQFDVTVEEQQLKHSGKIV